jgi:hypothetical protein
MIDPKAPEFETVDDFVLYLFDDERTTFTAPEVNAVRARRAEAGVQWSFSDTVAALKAAGSQLGMTLAFVAPAGASSARGFTANDHNRFTGNESAGGSGWSQVVGFAGQEG